MAQPTRPAPVSGPGAHSARTDGGPGSGQGTAQLASAGGAYGERKAIEGQAAAAPVPTSGGSGGSSGPVPPASGGGGAGLFGPSVRPNEPITAGANLGGGPQSPTNDYAGKHTDMVIEQAFKNWPSPFLLGLMAPR